jgi:hypothetical protein
VESFLLIGAKSVNGSVSIAESVNFEVGCKEMSDLSPLEEPSLMTLVVVGYGLFQLENVEDLSPKIHTCRYNELKMKRNHIKQGKQNNFRLGSRHRNFVCLLSRECNF